MISEKQRKVLAMAGIVGLALILPATLAVIGARQMWAESRAPQLAPEHSASLKEAVERAADAALPVPTIAADALLIECTPDELEPQVQRVVRLAGGVGGAASSWNDGMSIRIIAKIPADADRVYRDAVARGLYDIKIAAGLKETTIVEVLIKPTGKNASKAKKN